MNNFALSLLFVVFCVFSGANSADDKKYAISPIPDAVITNQSKVNLGRQLFFDKRLSADNTISCNSCHPLDRGGMDGLPISIGINGLSGPRNTPTVYNSSLNFRQFWDGRVRTLEQQVSGPVHNPLEMGTNWQSIVDKLAKDKDMIKLFKTAFGQAGEINSNNIISAIVAFERSLLTPDSPFDLYLKGDDNAIDSETKQGFQLFKKYGCISCHNGVAIGANMYASLGVVFPYYVSYDQSPSFDENEDNDLGRYHITGVEKDKFKFKVPSLRNIALTAPYFHDGSIKNLFQAVSIMIKYQLGKPVEKEHVNKIILFLHSLTSPLATHQQQSIILSSSAKTNTEKN